MEKISQNLLDYLINNGYEKTETLPTVEEVIDWLKKTHNIEIKIKFIPHTWMYIINDIGEEKRFNEYKMYIFKTFYDAAFNAFDYIFNNILIK
jgi:hypothetical protein